jgi:hypothetical protein
MKVFLNKFLQNFIESVLQMTKKQKARLRRNEVRPTSIIREA